MPAYAGVTIWLASGYANHLLCTYLSRTLNGS